MAVAKSGLASLLWWIKENLGSDYADSVKEYIETNQPGNIAARKTLDRFTVTADGFVLIDYQYPFQIYPGETDLSAFTRKMKDLLEA